MAQMRTRFTYLHSTPGRMRICVAAYRGDEQACRWVEEALAAYPGIARVSANPLTGSVLVLFDPTRFDDRQVLAALGDLGLSGDLIATPAVTPDGPLYLASLAGRLGPDPTISSQTPL